MECADTEYCSVLIYHSIDLLLQSMESHHELSGSIESRYNLMWNTLFPLIMAPVAKTNFWGGAKIRGNTVIGQSSTTVLY